MVHTQVLILAKPSSKFWKKLIACIRSVLWFMSCSFFIHGHMQISMVTLDNASNNATMMSEIQAELNGRGIAFDHEGNRIRYVSLLFF